MNLEDLIDPEYGLQQDEWSLSKPKFGKDNQLEVIGWSEKSNRGNKIYIIKCNICSQDPELFGEGYFKFFKGDLVRGYLPCGCSKNTHWSVGQYEILCKRKADERGYTFLGFDGQWRKQKTKIKVLCHTHGMWDTGLLHHFINNERGCPTCKAENTGKWAKINNLKSDEVMIASFFASGAFHPETRFWKSTKTTRQGARSYWFVSCPECGGTAEALSGNLQRGGRPCDCIKQRQQECYINLIVDKGEAVAIKFGIARDSKERIKNQKRRAVYELHQHSVYTLPDAISCRNSERQCRQELECGVVLKRDMPDGYTETTWVYNLEKIIEIYEKNGGILNE